MDKRDITLKDILDFDHLQALQDSFAKVASITTVVIDPQGYPLTRPSNLYGFCELMQGSEKGVQKCMATNARLTSENQKTKKPASIICPHSGLVTAAVPIFLEDQYLGSWILGQVRIEDPADDVLEATACATDTDADELKNVMRGLPVLTREQFDHVFAYLEALTETIIKLAQAGWEKERQNEALRRLSREMEMTGQMLTRFADSADVIMYVSDFETGGILMSNEKMADITGLSKDTLAGMNCGDIVLGVDPKSKTCEPINRGSLVDKDGNPNGKIHSTELYNAERNRWFKRSAQAIHWVDGRLAFMTTYTDITKEIEMKDRLEHLAYFDAALHIPNMLKLTQDVDADPAKDAFLICFDITALRHVNDVFGRHAGDSLLREIADWIQALGIPHSVLYRLGGDEFCIRIKNTDIVESMKYSKKIYRRFDDPWELGLDGEAIWVYCGVSLCIIDGNLRMQEGDSLISLIERGLDTSREKGGIAMYDEKKDADFKEHVRLEVNLKNCINTDMLGFDVHYQPIVEPRSGRWRGLEALCRWTSPAFGPIPPLVFIHEAEQQGLIDILGQWVLEAAVRQCKTWRLDCQDGFILDVNFSPLQMTDVLLEAKIRRVLEQYDFPGSHLCIEITESRELNFSSHVEHSIANLRKQNIIVALDDFGTGYSSFQNLKNIPVSLLKTERQFVMNIEKDNYLQNLFRTMVELAHAANMKLIAEGVETEEQKKLLEINGADYMQGYLFSRPLSAAQMEQHLHRFESY